MKKPVIVWIVAAVFAVCSVPLFAKGDAGAGACGIVIAAALAVYGVICRKKAEAAAEEAGRTAAEQKAAEARKQEYDARHGLLEVSVAGVTFDNDDGTSRQRLLSGIYKEAEGGGTAATLEEYEFKGKPAVRVLVEGKCVGVIRNADLPQVLPIVRNVEAVILYADRFKDDGGETVYRADLRIEYAK